MRRSLHIAFFVAILTSVALFEAPESSAQISSNLLDRPITREEAASLVLMTRTATPPHLIPDDTFRDVSTDSPHTPYLLLAEKARLLTAFDGVFLRPNGEISQTDFVHMLRLAFPQSPDSQLYISAVSAGINSRKPVTVSEAITLVRIALKYRQQQYVRAGDTLVAREVQLGDTSVWTITSSTRDQVVSIAAVPRNTKKTTSSLQPQTVDQLRAALLRHINTQRVELGKRPLRYNIQLEESAQLYAERMANEGFFSHTAPDGSILRDRILGVGYGTPVFEESCNCMTGMNIAENLAQGQRTIEEVFTAWNNSPSHRDAMLGNQYAETGIGISSGLWVQHFGGRIVPVR